CGWYILAWSIVVFVICYLVEENINSLNFFKIFIYNVFGAMLIVYLCGVTYLSFVSNLPWGPTALSALTFLPGDLIKVVIASAITIKVNQVYPIIGTDKHATA